MSSSESETESDESIIESDSDSEDTPMTQDPVAPQANDAPPVPPPGHEILPDQAIAMAVDEILDALLPRPTPLRNEVPVAIPGAGEVAIEEAEVLLVDQPERTNVEDGPTAVEAREAIEEPEAIIVDQAEHTNGADDRIAVEAQEAVVVGQAEQTNGTNGLVAVRFPDAIVVDELEQAHDIGGPVVIEAPEAIVVDGPEHTNGENEAQQPFTETPLVDVSEPVAQPAVSSSPPSRGPSPPPPPPGAVHIIAHRPDTDDDEEKEPRRRLKILRRKPKTSNTNTRIAGRYFQAGEYEKAEALYTKAITADSLAPLILTNRAMARVKLGMYQGVVDDCDESLRLLPHNMKAYYYKCQALLEMKRPHEALEAGKKAYDLAANSRDHAWERSLGNIVSWVLKCKKAVWEKREAARLREREPLKLEVLELMQKECEREVEAVEEADKEDVRKMWQEKMERVGKVWEKAEGVETQRREVPEYMIDDITFAIMHDPVITKTGNSYERASIMEHLRRSHTDPLTRSPLSPEELRPNIALREACEAFLEENGWAVDY